MFYTVVVVVVVKPAVIQLQPLFQQAELTTCSHTLRLSQQYRAALQSQYGLQAGDMRAGAITAMEVRLNNLRQAVKDKDSSG